MRLVGMVLIASLVLSGCTNAPSGGGTIPGSTYRRGVPAIYAASGAAGKITHIIFIVQENRTFDNIFGGPNPFPGADAAKSGKTSNGATRVLSEEPLATVGGTDDPNNFHQQWLTACHPTSGPPFKVGQPAPCRMDGFDATPSPAPGHTPAATAPAKSIYSYINYNESKPYWNIAQTYTLGDHFFMGHNSESYTGHQYIFSGQSNHVTDAPELPSDVSCSTWYVRCVLTPWGCDSPPGTKTFTIDPISGAETPNATGPFPCFGFPHNNIPYHSLAGLVSAKNLMWRLYAFSLCQNIVGLDVNGWIRYANSFWPTSPRMSGCHDHESLITPTPVNTEHFRMTQDRFLDNVAAPNGDLANVTWILPGPLSSDHPGVPLGWCGPSWVSTVINAVGKSKYWNSTAIFVLWDDWGGYYDHVPPYVVRDQEGPGFRVPLLVVSPYAKRGHVAHTNVEFATLLKFTEKTLGLDSLEATDTSPYLNNLDDFFDFSAPKPFVRIRFPNYQICFNENTVRPANAAKSRWLRMIGDD